jgi:hypothetical protein
VCSSDLDWFLAHPYPMPPNYTGRVAERAMLTRWLDTDAAHPLLSLRALGGFGKSALAWHWLTHDVKPAAWPRVVWWSFYEGDASFDHFLADTLEYLGVEESLLQSLSPHERVEKLLQLLHTPGTLLILDGFERLLRAFGGLNAAFSIMAALFHRERTGEGQFIDIALLDSIMPLILSKPSFLPCVIK